MNYTALGGALTAATFPGSPGCLPGRRLARSRSDRSLPFFLYGLSDDEGRDEVDESLPAQRSSSSIREVSPAISRYASASRAASSACGNADSSSAEGTPGASGTAAHHRHSRPPVNNPPLRVASARQLEFVHAP
jgi:hypothetical protein